VYHVGDKVYDSYADSNGISYLIQEVGYPPRQEPLIGFTNKFQINPWMFV